VNVIPSGTNFNFLFYGLLKYVACMLALGFVGAFLSRALFGWAPKPVRNTMINIGIGVGVFAGLYVGALLNP
jgi:uncharacterized membrane protein